MSKKRIAYARKSCIDPEEEGEELPFEPRDIVVHKDYWVTRDYEMQEVLGRGRFGEVKRCVEISSGMILAAKTISTKNSADKDSVVKEIEVMSLLRHPKVLQIYDAFENSRSMCIVTELVEGGELFDRVVDPNFDLTERVAILFMRQIVDGMAYIHSQNIIHLDLKPENIICVAKTGTRVKIIDFGLAMKWSKASNCKIMAGTVDFMAPETCNYENVSPATDMWSVGVICYVLVSGLSPFVGDDDSETICNIMKVEYDFAAEEFEEITAGCKDFIKKLLLYNPRQRMSAEDCLKHSWLQKITRSQTKKHLSKKHHIKFFVKRKWNKVIKAVIAMNRLGRLGRARLLGDSYNKESSAMDSTANLGARLPALETSCIVSSLQTSHLAAAHTTEQPSKPEMTDLDEQHTPSIAEPQISHPSRENLDADPAFTLITIDVCSNVAAQNLSTRSSYDSIGSAKSDAENARPVAEHKNCTSPPSSSRHDTTSSVASRQSSQSLPNADCEAVLINSPGETPSRSSSGSSVVSKPSSEFHGDFNRSANLCRTPGDLVPHTAAKNDTGELEETNIIEPPVQSRDNRPMNSVSTNLYVDAAPPINHGNYSESKYPLDLSVNGKRRGSSVSQSTDDCGMSSRSSSVVSEASSVNLGENADIIDNFEILSRNISTVIDRTCAYECNGLKMDCADGLSIRSNCSTAEEILSNKHDGTPSSRTNSGSSSERSKPVQTKEILGQSSLQRSTASRSGNNVSDKTQEIFVHSSEKETPHRKGEAYESDSGSGGRILPFESRSDSSNSDKRRGRSQDLNTHEQSPGKGQQIAWRKSPARAYQSHVAPENAAEARRRRIAAILGEDSTELNSATKTTSRSHICPEVTPDKGAIKSSQSHGPSSERSYYNDKSHESPVRIIQVVYESDGSNGGLLDARKQRIAAISGDQKDAFPLHDVKRATESPGHSVRAHNSSERGIGTDFNTRNQRTTTLSGGESAPESKHHNRSSSDRLRRIANILNTK